MRGWLLAMVLIGYWLIDLSAVRVWRSEVALWRHAVAQAPTQVRATGNYARSLFAQGATVEGIP